MEIYIPLCITTDFFIYSSLFTPIEISLEDDCLGDIYADFFATGILDAKYEQIKIHNVAFNQHHLPSINYETYSTFYPNKKYLMASLESIHIKRFTLTSNLELSQCIIMLAMFLSSIDKSSKKSLTTWSI